MYDLSFLLALLDAIHDTCYLYLKKKLFMFFIKKLKFKEMKTMTMGENIIKDQQNGRNKKFGGNFPYKNEKKRNNFGVYCHEN